MNKTYKHIYLSDKSEKYVSKVPHDDLKEATEGLEMIKNDDNVTVWDCEQYQVFAIKA